MAIMDEIIIMMNFYELHHVDLKLLQKRDVIKFLLE